MALGWFVDRIVADPAIDWQAGGYPDAGTDPGLPVKQSLGVSPWLESPVSGPSAKHLMQLVKIRLLEGCRGQQDSEATTLAFCLMVGAE